MDTNTTPPAGPHPEQPTATGPGTVGPGTAGPRVAWDDVKDVRRLRRSRSERMLSGVAGGLARHFDVDPLLVRIGFGLLTLLGGAGVVLYVGLWLIVPQDGDEQGTIALDTRNRQFALIGVAVVAALVLMGGWSAGDMVWPLIVVAAALGWFLYDNHNGGRTRPDAAQADAKVAAYGGAHDAAPGVAPGVTPAVSLTKEAPAPWTPPADTWTDQAGAYTTYTPPPRTRRSDPRRRGPILFWIVLALAALAVGLLGTADLAGVDVPASAYPATVTGVAALGLLLGAFWGRAGGLIALGLVAAAVTAMLSSVEQYPRTETRIVPLTAADVEDSYDFRAGTFVLDLSQVRDVEALAERAISVAGGLGQIEIVVPDDMAASVEGNVGVGDLWALGASHSGIGLTHYEERWNDEVNGENTTWINVDLGVGQAVVREESDVAPALSGTTRELIEENR